MMDAKMEHLYFTEMGPVGQAYQALYHGAPVPTEPDALEAYEAMARERFPAGRLNDPCPRRKEATVRIAAPLVPVLEVDRLTVGEWHQATHMVPRGMSDRVEQLDMFSPAPPPLMTAQQLADARVVHCPVCNRTQEAEPGKTLLHARYYCNGITVDEVGVGGRKKK